MTTHPLCLTMFTIHQVVNVELSSTPGTEKEGRLGRPKASASVGSNSARRRTRIRGKNLAKVLVNDLDQAPSCWIHQRQWC